MNKIIVEKPERHLEREEATKEIDSDIKKDIRHLMIDAHSEAINNERPTMENIIHSQKRFFSLVGNIAISNEKLSRRIFILTIVTGILGLIQAIPIIISFFRFLYCVFYK